MSAIRLLEPGFRIGSTIAKMVDKHRDRGAVLFDQGHVFADGGEAIVLVEGDGSEALVIMDGVFFGVRFGGCREHGGDVPMKVFRPFARAVYPGAV